MSQRLLLLQMAAHLRDQFVGQDIREQGPVGRCTRRGVSAQRQAFGMRGQQGPARSPTWAAWLNHGQLPRPLSKIVPDTLFLYFLSEQAEALSHLPVASLVDADDVPY